MANFALSVLLIFTFNAYSAIGILATARRPLAFQTLTRSSSAVPLSQKHGAGRCGQTCRSLVGLLMAQRQPRTPRTTKVTMFDEPLAPPKAKEADHTISGPVLFSWACGALTLSLQAQFTDWKQFNQDATFVSDLLAALPGKVFLESHGGLAFYALLYTCVIGSSFFVFPALWPPQSTDDSLGNQIPTEVPKRRKNMRQHKLTSVDYSYMMLNSLCMPGLFYHFITLMRSWGLDLNDPPLFGIYPSSMEEIVTQTVPELVVSLSLYMLTYEFIYYWWHRSMHEVPALYKWVHKHHHLQTYPDRAAIDTLNTGCLESQAGLYMQLAVLWSCGKFLGVASLPGACWFFTLAGWLSVVEHDKFERALPFDFFRTDEHHMHHAFVKCNYCPYSTVWDRLFGTFKPFEVMPSQQNVSNGADLGSAHSLAGKVDVVPPLGNDAYVPQIKSPSGKGAEVLQPLGSVSSVSQIKLPSDK